MIHVRFNNTGYVKCKHGVIIALYLAPVVYVPCCRVKDRDIYPRCFGLSRIDSSTWLIEAGNYLELPQAVAIIQVPEDLDYFT